MSSCCFKITVAWKRRRWDLSVYIDIGQYEKKAYPLYTIVNIHIFSSTNFEIFVHNNMLCGFWLTYNKWVQVGNWTIHIRCIIYRNRPHCWKKYCKVKDLACFILPNSYLGVNWWSNKVSNKIAHDFYSMHTRTIYCIYEKFLQSTYPITTFGI